MNGNVARLREVGLIFGDPVLPDNYKELVEGLTEDEIEVLVSLKGRLDALGIPYEPLQTAPNGGVGGQIL